MQRTPCVSQSVRLTALIAAPVSFGGRGRCFTPTTEAQPPADTPQGSPKKAQQSPGSVAPIRAAISMKRERLLA